MIRLAVGLAVACMALTLNTGVPGAQAQTSVCYTDPVVVLSDGTTLDLNDTINDSLTDVQQIQYTLHAPCGTSIISIVYTSGPIGPKESLRFYADQPAGQYTSTSDVTTGSSSIAVVAAGTAVRGLSTETSSADGWNGQKIKLALTS
jgi:hypothetical protein